MPPINKDIQVGDLVTYFDNFCVVVSLRDNLIGPFNPKICNLLVLRDMNGYPMDREHYMTCSVVNLKKL